MEALFLGMEEAVVGLLAGMSALGVVFLVIALATLGLFFTLFFRVLIAYWMAKNRHRDPLGWVLLSFCFSPLLTWIILLIVGDADKK